MTRIVTVLTEGFADWEIALLNAVAKGFYGMETSFASPGGRPVTSMGGMRVAPELAVEALDPATFDALVVYGGAAWKRTDAPDISDIARRTHAAGKLVAGICDGTFALAKTGLLDGIAHTSNGVGYLDETGYSGKGLYRDGPEAVTDRRIVTAPGTSPVSFMAAVMAGLGAADDRLRYYVGLHAAQFSGLQQAA